MSWKEQAQQRIKEKSDGATIKITEGNNCLRVLPDKKDLLPDGRLGPKGAVHPPYREFRIHRNVGPDEAMVACGKDIEGKGECWLCDIQIPSLEASGVDTKRLQASKIGPQEQFIVNASKIDTDTGKFAMPKPWWVSTGSGIPGKQAQSLAVRVYSKIASSKRDFVDPNKGYNLNVERTGTGLKTRYPAVESDESPSVVPKAVLAAVKDLDAVVPQYDIEDQKSAYFGRPKREGETVSGPRGARRAAPVEQEEEPPVVEDEQPPEENYSESAEDQPEGEQQLPEEYEAEAEPEAEPEPEVEPEPEYEAEPEPEPEYEAEPEPEPAPRRPAAAPAARRPAPPAPPAPSKRVSPAPAARPAAGKPPARPPARAAAAPARRK